jgi:hypothetical protein
VNHILINSLFKPYTTLAKVQCFALRALHCFRTASVSIIISQEQQKDENNEVRVMHLWCGGSSVVSKVLAAVCSAVGCSWLSDGS